MEQTRQQHLEQQKRIRDYQENQKRLRAELQELKLKAEYWKAQWEIRHYTLECEKLKPDYEVYTDRELKEQERRMQEFQDMVAKMNKAAEDGEVNVESNELTESTQQEV